jgi:hypothetical protein
MTASAAISSMHMIDAAADAVHSSPARSTGYKNATPSGSLSLDQASAASSSAKTLRWSTSPTSALVLT